MKYRPELYAKALAELVRPSMNENEMQSLIKNFLAIVRKNGDAPILKKILSYAEKFLRKKSGQRKVVIETARPYANIQKKFHDLFKAGDVIEERIHPELTAGVRITIDDELEFDNSLARKMQNFFK